jgi:hypothetical protein
MDYSMINFSLYFFVYHFAFVGEQLLCKRSNKQLSRHFIGQKFSFFGKGVNGIVFLNAIRNVIFTLF